MLIIFHPPRNAEGVWIQRMGGYQSGFTKSNTPYPNTMRNPKRKDKERVERGRVHSAGLASVTSSESCSKESGSMMTLALASATELLASHCIQMAEQAGADRECVAATVRSSIDIHKPLLFSLHTKFLSCASCEHIHTKFQNI
ncbi:unnamed protein product [Brassica rapa subsp. narinosa]